MYIKKSLSTIQFLRNFQKYAISMNLLKGRVKNKCNILLYFQKKTNKTVNSMTIIRFFKILTLHDAFCSIV